MSYERLRERVLANPISSFDGNHSARIWRIAENVRDHAHREPLDDRLHHLMSRVGVLSRGLAKDLRDGHLSQTQVVLLLEQLADLGDLSFEQWRQAS